MRMWLHESDQCTIFELYSIRTREIGNRPEYKDCCSRKSIFVANNFAIKLILVRDRTDSRAVTDCCLKSPRSFELKPAYMVRASVAQRISVASCNLVDPIAVSAER